MKQLVWLSTFGLKETKVQPSSWSSIQVHPTPAIFIMTPKFNPKEIKVVDLVCMDGKVDADSALAPKSAPRCAFRKAGSDIAKRISDWKHLDSSEIDSEWKDPK
ncbi:60S ribosomal protein L12 [Camelus dromedarius]|uniref:60S ribosomal protein L12 n=1 Tax=Camelus dromedarius TaxID=9838 RepID=A0A5N4EKF6_CAMDR|nr:60S ribosomal protein L12 [Camelus dromedarius]